MKKYLYILIFAYLIAPTVSFAISGACSDHGGVDCSIKSSAFAICNDGTESSVFYVSVNECQNDTSYTPYCAAPYLSGCTTQADYNQLQTSYGRMGDGAPNNVNAQLAQCQQQIQNNVQKEQTYQTCLSAINNPQPNPLVTQFQQETIETEKETAQLKAQGDETVNATMQAWCNDNYSVNSFYDATNTKGCDCNNGYQYSLSNDHCVITPPIIQATCSNVSVSVKTATTISLKKSLYSDLIPKKNVIQKLATTTSSIFDNLASTTQISSSTIPEQKSQKWYQKISSFIARLFGR